MVNRPSHPASLLAEIQPQAGGPFLASPRRAARATPAAHPGSNALNHPPPALPVLNGPTCIRGPGWSVKG